jgi:hypothetical protein
VTLDTDMEREGVLRALGYEMKCGRRDGNKPDEQQGQRRVVERKEKPSIL